MLSLQYYTFAQAVNIQWVKHIRGLSYEREPSIAIDQQNNCYITGVFHSPSVFFGNDSLNHTSPGGSGLEDIFLAKYDASGNLVWAKHAGGGNIDQSKSIAVDNSSNVYITGSFYGSATFGNVTLTGSGATMFIAKYNPQGDLLWIRQAVSTGFSSSQGISLSLDNSGNCFVTGEIGFSGITFGTFTLTPFGAVDMFIAKYDPNGNVLWAKNAGGPGADRGYTLSLDDEGNSYIAGQYGYNGGNANFDNLTLTNSDNEGRYFIVKYNSLGNALWAKTAPSGEITVDGMGNIYQTGSFNGNIDIGSFSLASSGLADIYFAKYDNLGNAVWAKKAGGSEPEFPGSVAIDSDNNIFFSGSFSGTANFDNISITSSIQNEMFIAKYSQLGEIIWVQKGLGGKMAFNNLDEMYISGAFTNDVTIGNTQLINMGLSDIFVAKLSTINGLPSSPASHLSTYPNPFSTYFQIPLPGTAPATATLTDMLGRQVLWQVISAENGNETATVTPPANLPSGMYLLQVQEGENVRQVRVVKQ